MQLPLLEVRSEQRVILDLGGVDRAFAQLLRPDAVLGNDEANGRDPRARECHEERDGSDDRCRRWTPHDREATSTLGRPALPRIPRSSQA